jgi:hypothetical protein
MSFVLSGIALQTGREFVDLAHTVTRMRSPKQIEASRTNGRLSKGPITPEGKYHSSRNNTRHGLLAQTVVLEKESEERFLELLDEYMQTHQPQSPTETALVETMVVARWRLLRIWGLQKLAMDQDIASQDSDLGPSSVRAMYAVRGSPDTPPKPDVLLRYEIMYDRQFKSSLRHLQSESRHRKSPAQPYFPAHPSGHNWKPEEEAASDSPNRDRQGAGTESSQESSVANPKTPHTVRPRQVTETTTPPKSDPKAKREQKIQSQGAKRRVHLQIRGPAA